jgi:hypothetical protein
VRDLATGEERELRPAGASIRDLMWTPDSRALAYRARDSKGRLGIYKLTLADGATQFLFHPTATGSTDELRVSARWTHVSLPHQCRSWRSAHLARPDLWRGARDSAAVIGYLADGILPDGTRFAAVDRRHKEGVAILFTLDERTGERRDLLRLNAPEEARFYPPPGCRMASRFSSGRLAGRNQRRARASSGRSLLMAGRPIEST